jgi:hypothetical protein
MSLTISPFVFPINLGFWPSFAARRRGSWLKINVNIPELKFPGQQLLSLLMGL